MFLSYLRLGEPKIIPKSLQQRKGLGAKGAVWTRPIELNRQIGLNCRIELDSIELKRRIELKRKIEVNDNKLMICIHKYRYNKYIKQMYI